MPSLTAPCAVRAVEARQVAAPMLDNLCRRVTSAREHRYRARPPVASDLHGVKGPLRAFAHARVDPLPGLCSALRFSLGLRPPLDSASIRRNDARMTTTPAVSSSKSE